MRWQDVEKEVRRIAESVWTVSALPRHESGIDCDCVLKVKPNYWVLIEISKRDDLDKLRSDVARMAFIRHAQMAKQIFCECYFVTNGNPKSLIESGEAIDVEVHDRSTFASKFLGARFYINERRTAPFGSAVHPDTGTVDDKPYTPIIYRDSEGGKYDVNRICKILQEGKKIALIGEFGTGKSRCLMEIFDHLSSDQNPFTPIAINLRDNWGYKRFNHILENHLDALGLGKYRDNLVRSLRRGNHVLLLDGFDEIGSQSWSGEPNRLIETRKKSLEGVRDLVSNCSGAGIIITGREHYFSSDDEMAECIGISRDKLLVIKCPDEFTDEEAKTYLKSATHLQEIPDWMPKKPLICQLLARLEPEEIDRLQKISGGEVDFFEIVFDAICQRETRIHPSIHKDVLKGILLRLAQETREKPSNDEKITTTEINQSFFDVAGYSPIDESAILLQRLPYLGRVGSGGAERIFIDQYAKDGLRALALVECFSTSSKAITRSKWIQPLHEFGVQVFCNKIFPNHDTEKYVRLCIKHGNAQVGCDYVAAKLFVADEDCDFGGLSISGGAIYGLNLVDLAVSNLTLSGVEIENMAIESAQFSSVRIEHCVVSRITGIGDANKLPEVFVECTYGIFDAALSSARISELKLSNQHKTLLSLIKKLFFQPGAGRQEKALLRGTEAYWDHNAAQKALSYMQSNNIVVKAKGNHGTLFLPKRKFTRRMAMIWELRSNCNDELWDCVI